YLVDPLFYHQIDTFEELVEQNYELIFPKEETLFHDSEFNSTSYMKWIIGGENSLLYLHNGVKRAVFIPQEAVNYFYNTICDGKIRNNLHRITTFQKQHHLAVEFTNKHFEKRFYVLLNRLIESGLPDKLVNDILYFTDKPLTYKISTDEDRNKLENNVVYHGNIITSKKMSDVIGYYYPFSLNHLKSAFFLYFIGC
ncbi:hypothetical protein L9F63_001952, partial [Diploptera punctata]